MLPHPMVHSIFPYSEVERHIGKWDFVIKVKHGDTLRRLGGHADGKLMDYTMDKLKNKLITLFKFSDDADFILTYTDIDGDIVTIDSDDELCDAVIGQRLNPIRITVQLKSKSDTTSSDASLLSETSSVAPVPSYVFDSPKAVCADMFNVVDKALPYTPATEVQNFVERPSQVGLLKSNQSKPVRESASIKPSVVPANPVNHDIAYEPKWSYFPTLSSDKKFDLTTKQNDSTQTVNARGFFNPLEELHDSFSTANKAANSTMLFGFPKLKPIVSANSSYTPAEGGNKSTSNEAPNFPFAQINPGPPPQRPDKPNTIHGRVQFDGLGAHTIVGPRFMSNSKEDHNVCSNVSCAQMWNQAAGPYFPTHWASGKFHHGYDNKSTSSTSNFVSPHSKLDSVFIKDVTVLDGTVMPPSTPFTKIWRMRNNGTASWPSGTKLVWVGGDQLAHKSSILLEQIPARGLAVDRELDVAVDFSTPSRPGCYVSYWRLQSPSLQMFGQRVWALFEVKYNENIATATINLNLPPQNNTDNANTGININADPVEGTSCEVGSTEATKNRSIRYVQVESSSAVPHFVKVMKTTDDKGLVKHTAVDSTLVADALSNVNDYCKDGYENSVEENCLNELKEMGFKQTELNKEILRNNKYNLGLTIQDLCGLGQWDPLLAELHNMRFNDRELNKKMLVKNGGSIKRTVLDLLAEKKD